MLPRFQSKAECNISSDALCNLVQCIRDTPGFDSIEQKTVAEVGGNRPKVLADGGCHGASVLRRDGGERCRCGLDPAGSPSARTRTKV